MSYCDQQQPLRFQSIPPDKKNPSPQYGYFLVGRVGWIVVKWITTTTTTAATHPLCVRGKGFWGMKNGFRFLLVWLLKFCAMDLIIWDLG